MLFTSKASINEIWSTSADFVALVPSAGLSFEEFGHATQGDLDDFKNLKFPDDPVSKITLQSLWAHHHNRHGEKVRRHDTYMTTS